MSSELPNVLPVISPDGRFFRVSIVRSGRVESYLCETEAEANRWAALVAQPPTDAQRCAHRPPARDGGALSNAAQAVLRLVRFGAMNWKPRY